MNLKEIQHLTEKNKLRVAEEERLAALQAQETTAANARKAEEERQLEIAYLVVRFKAHIRLAAQAGKNTVQVEDKEVSVERCAILEAAASQFEDFKPERYIKSIKYSDNGESTIEHEWWENHYFVKFSW